MTPRSPLESEILFRIGAVPIARSVVTSTCIVVLLAFVSWAITRRFDDRPGRLQTAIEAMVLTVGDQVRGVIGRDPEPFLPVIGTLFLFIVTANLSAAVPGVKPPTASIETPAALALAVFFSVHVYGIREKGFFRYLASFLKPNPLLLPIRLLSEITRTFSLTVRLFGNMMSHELVLGVIAAIAGLLVPIPFLALGILIGVIQAYIFSILATVYLGAAIGAVDEGEPA